MPGFQDDFLLQLISKSELQTYKKQEVVWKQGEKSNKSIYVLVSGALVSFQDFEQDQPSENQRNLLQKQKNLNEEKTLSNNYSSIEINKYLQQSVIHISDQENKNKQKNRLTNSAINFDKQQLLQQPGVNKDNMASLISNLNNGSRAIKKKQNSPLKKKSISPPKKNNSLDLQIQILKSSEFNTNEIQQEQNKKIEQENLKKETYKQMIQKSLSNKISKEEIEILKQEYGFSSKFYKLGDVLFDLQSIDQDFNNQLKIKKQSTLLSGENSTQVIIIKYKYLKELFLTLQSQIQPKAILLQNILKEKQDIDEQLSPIQLIQMFQKTYFHAYQKGDVIMQEGSSQKQFFIINQGQVEIQKLFEITAKSAQKQLTIIRKQLSISVLEKGDYFGEDITFDLMNQFQYKFTAIAHSDKVEVLSINLNNFNNNFPVKIQKTLKTLFVMRQEQNDIKINQRSVDLKNSLNEMKRKQQISIEQITDQIKNVIHRSQSTQQIFTDENNQNNNFQMLVTEAQDEQGNNVYQEMKPILIQQVKQKNSSKQQIKGSINRKEFQFQSCLIKTQQNFFQNNNFQDEYNDSLRKTQTTNVPHHKRWLSQPNINENLTRNAFYQTESQYFQKSKTNYEDKFNNDLQRMKIYPQTPLQFGQQIEIDQIRLKVITNSQENVQTDIFSHYNNLIKKRLHTDLYIGGLQPLHAHKERLKKIFFSRYKLFKQNYLLNQDQQEQKVQNINNYQNNNLKIKK